LIFKEDLEQLVVKRDQARVWTTLKTEIWPQPLVLFFDTIIWIFFGIWIFGGIYYENHLYLKHGADPRRAGLIVGLLGFLLFSKLRKQSINLRLAQKFFQMLQKEKFRWAAILIVAIASIFLAVLQTRALRFPLYDVGIFHQVLWSISQGLGFHSTISGAGDFLTDHYSPSLALLTPFFLGVDGSPYFLPVVHVLLLFGGASAWVYLASRMAGVSESFGSKLAAACVLFALSFESIWGNIHWGFHENGIAFFSVSWAFALIGTLWRASDSRSRNIRKGLIVVLLLVAAGSKEILLLNVGMILICWTIYERKGNIKWNIAFSVIALLLFWQFVRFETMPHPADKNYFDRYYSYLGHGLSDFAKNLFLHPGLVVGTIGAKELIRYIATVFVPWLFLPLILLVWAHKKRKTIPPELRSLARTPWIICILPSFASAALATYPPLRGGHFHYVLELWPVLAFLTLVGLAMFRSEKLIWVWVFLGLLRMDFDPIGEIRGNWKESQKLTAIRNKLSEIPKSTILVADELAGPWVAGRQWITRWPDLSLLPKNCPDLILIRNAAKGSFAELGVREIIARCEAGTNAPPRNSDLRSRVPLWTLNDWTAFSLSVRR
jgi:uncharacterized membrane protein